MEPPPPALHSSPCHRRERFSTAIHASLSLIASTASNIEARASMARWTGIHAPLQESNASAWNQIARRQIGLVVAAAGHQALAQKQGHPGGATDAAAAGLSSGASREVARTLAGSMTHVPSHESTLLSPEKHLVAAIVAVQLGTLSWDEEHLVSLSQVQAPEVLLLQHIPPGGAVHVKTSLWPERMAAPPSMPQKHLLVVESRVQPT